MSDHREARAEDWAPGGRFAVEPRQDHHAVIGQLRAQVHRLELELTEARVEQADAVESALRYRAVTRDKVVDVMLGAFEPGEPWTISQIGAAAAAVVALLKPDMIDGAVTDDRRP